MQQGLHVGLAAWIHQRRPDGGFPAWPALTFATSLVDLHAVSTNQQLAQAAEFARLANFTPRKGSLAQTFDQTGVLWDRHRDVIARMAFAYRPWTKQEQHEYEAARAVLYQDPDDGHFLTPTPVYQLYQEFAAAYADLRDSGADNAALQQAMSRWLVEGQKRRIEAARATIERLDSRSSLTSAEAQRYELDPTRLLSSATDSYAPTFFAPISAADGATWTEAEVSLDELDAAVGDLSPRSKWRNWRANKVGVVRFAYTALAITRPWFEAGLYAADDWRMEDGAQVAAGDGRTGELPAYVNSVYLVRLLDLRIKAPERKPSGGRKAKPPITAWMKPQTYLKAQPQVFRPRTGVIPNTKPAKMNTVKKTRFVAAGSKGLSAPSARPAGVKHSQSSRITHARGVARHSQIRSIQRHDAIFRQFDFGRIKQITQLQIDHRLTRAQQLIAAQSVSSARNRTGVAEDVEEPGGIYVVGFGCSKLPPCPMPNPDYQWTIS